MFGTYNLDVHLEEEGIELRVEGTGRRRRYYRKAGGEEVEKVVYADRAKLIVCPVEPVNVPDTTISEHLLTELTTPAVIASGSRDTFYVKFPVEIGVFVVDSRDVERIDIFTKTQPKYTLYGPPERGIVCKWWKSDLYMEEPEVDRLFEGVMQVDVKNDYYQWMELHHVVFWAFDMKIFYNRHAFMHAHLTIQKRTIGETSFITHKPKNMHKAVDIYQAKGLKKLKEKYVMEWGFQ
ncbi:MAG TPA: DUF432 domain-containing protein [Thermoplasmatales archaeon]|nr:DUF432 domain-containing protein [Candidatus Thermoplasmatota archaeon]MDD5777855.1 DUF432 domain-containing protein [Candidatus Thermoplasmatota archaeon]HDS59065.1 DUF432 domain-containing protein [Thermoplasmatales archaeon]